MTIPAGVIIAWPSTAASIPAGWSRVTALDGKYPKHLATITNNPGSTGGNASHTHTASGHSHTTTHSHTSPTSNTEDAETTSYRPTGSAGFVNTETPTHQHYVGVNSASAGGSSTAVTWDAATAEPSYYSVIWIQSDGTPTGIPLGAVAFWNNATPPVNFSQHTASQGYYLKGATSGADAGATGGGTHGHASSTAHSHAAGGSHSHSGYLTGELDPAYWSNLPAGSLNVSTVNHGHSVSTGSGTITLTNATQAASGSTAIAPPYVALLAIIQNSGTPQQPVGLVCLWLGTLSSIPAGWSQITSIPVDKFFIAVTTPSNVLTTGGVLGHSHTAGATHTHPQSPGHSHSVTLGTCTGSANVSYSPTSPPYGCSGTHGHSTAVTSSTDTTASDPASDTALTIADDRPPFVEVALIQYGGPMTAAITAPTGSVSTPQPTVSWTITSPRVQSDYRAQLYAADGVTLLWDSGKVSTATQSFVMPAGILAAGNTYNIRVIVDATSGENAVSPLQSFSTSWTAPPALTGITCTPEGGP